MDPRRRTLGSRLLDAGGRAGRLELRGADLRDRVGAVELVGDDRVLDGLGAGDLAVDRDGQRNEGTSTVPLFTTLPFVVLAAGVLPEARSQASVAADSACGWIAL